jgi:uncharacterized protein with GYD domain
LRISRLARSTRGDRAESDDPLNISASRKASTVRHDVSLGCADEKPEEPVEQVGGAAAEVAGRKFIGGWLCLGEYDAVLIADVPDIESLAAIALAVPAGDALRSGRTPPLMAEDRGVTALDKATVAKTYRPAS